jgi:hypothetical protein
MPWSTKGEEGHEEVVNKHRVVNEHYANAGNKEGN